MEQLDEARAAYRKSITLRRDLGQTHMAVEPLAGLAHVCPARGDLGQALSHVETILDHLEAGGTFGGAISPVQVDLTCHRVFEINQSPRAQELLERANDLLQVQAGKIPDEEMRHSFLKNVAAHRELAQAFGRRSESQLT